MRSKLKQHIQSWQLSTPLNSMKESNKTFFATPRTSVSESTFPATAILTAARPVLHARLTSDLVKSVQRASRVTVPSSILLATAISPATIIASSSKRASRSTLHLGSTVTRDTCIEHRLGRHTAGTVRMNLPHPIVVGPDHDSLSVGSTQTLSSSCPPPATSGLCSSMRTNTSQSW